MMVKKIDLPALDLWIAGLIEQYETIGVQANADDFIFATLKRASDLRLDYDVTILPPKMLFQPQWEELLTYTETEGYQSVIDSTPFVIVGVHPYDLVAISQMDEIFYQNNPDLRYCSRRENATIVAVDVQNISPNTFAGFMGTAYVTEGYDILLTRIGEHYLVDAATEKGHAILGSVAQADDAVDADLDRRRKVWEDNNKRLRRRELRADPSTWGKLLDESYEHPVWDEKARLCFSCGSCTLVCPTCYCFDIRDDVGWDLRRAQRSRVWDGCMLRDFTAVAGGLNFRKDVVARYRHRYYRKGKYVPDRIGGRIACIGCGRCITACVANIANPVEIFNRLAEDRSWKKR